MSNEEDKSDISNKLRSLLEQERRRRRIEWVELPKHQTPRTSIEAVTLTVDEYTLIYQERYEKSSNVIEGSQLIEKSENRFVITPPQTRENDCIRGGLSIYFSVYTPSFLTISEL